MSNCLQNFEDIFFKLAEDTEGKNLFSIFSSEEKLNQGVDEVLKSKNIQLPTIPEGELDDKAKDKLAKYDTRKEQAKQELLENTKKSIAKQAFNDAKAETDDNLSYDLKKVKSTLTKVSKYYPLLFPISPEGIPDESTVNGIIDYLKQEIVKENDSLANNPIIKNESGDSVQLLDFSNMSNLTSGISSLESFINNELEYGFMKVIFVNVLKGRKDLKYEQFVVTNAALNHNINIYKNELWDDAVASAGITIPKGIDTNLYVDGKANKDLFIPRGAEGKSIYLSVLEKLKNDMTDIFQKESPEDHIRLYAESGHSKVQGYLKGLLLANFDSFILNKHSDKITLNYDSINSFGNPSNGENKYKLAFKWTKMVKIDNNEKSSDINESSSSLIKMLANVIPFYELNADNTWEEASKFTIGKSNLDSLGAVLNDLGPDIKIKLISHENGDIYTTSLGDAFKLYDKGQISFAEILGFDNFNDKPTKDEYEGYGLIGSSKLDNTLYSRESVLRSVANFLYGDRGVSEAFANWKLDNADISDFVPNPETAIINHLRNTVKNKYRIESLVGKGRSVDALNIEATIGKDLQELVNNVTKGWKSQNITDADLEAIKDNDSFFEFLTNPLKGGLTFSDRVKTKFQELNVDFDSKQFKANIRVLVPDNYAFSKTIIDPQTRAVSHIPYAEDDIIDDLKSPKFNNALKLVDLFQSKHYGAKYNVLSVVKNKDGKSLPTMGIAYAASLTNISLAEAESSQFFKENQHLINGIEISTEVENKTGTIGVDELNHGELFKLAFLKHFLTSGINDKRFFIQPWDFSDKSKVLNLSINADRGFFKDGIETTELRKMTSAQFKNEFYTRQQGYYNRLVDDVYDDYADLKASFGTKKPKNSEEKLQFIDDYLQSLNKKAKKLSLETGKSVKAIDLFREAVNDQFNKGKYIEVVDDLHFSNYKGELRVNQLLKGNTLIFNNKAYFEQYSKAKEENLINLIKTKNIYFSLDDIKLPILDKYATGPIKKAGLLEAFGMEDEDTFYEFSKGNTIQSRIKLYDEGTGNISELMGRYLWGRNLMISQYANLTTKDTFLHPIKQNFTEIDPSKEGWLNQYNKEETIRSTIFTKRMNMPGASMIVYNRGVNGISDNIKVAILDKADVEAFNTTGEVKGLDTSDGGGHSSPFFNELTTWSLPGLNLQKTQKPIGESITGKFATSLKFATFALNNEMIRMGAMSENSPYNMMKKMHSFNLYDGKYQNLLETKDAADRTSTFDIGVAFPNLWIPVGQEYKEFVKMNYLGKNEYSISYKGKKGAIEKTNPFQVNTLFDLWEAFGGAYSSTKENGELEYNEDSINIVSSIIKKHSTSNSPLKLKNKMISMLLPPSAVKKGGANVNTFDILANPDKKLSFFNFNTSFFGVQLDPYHSTEDGEVNEISQVMSAIAENSSTPELYNLVYNTISDIVKASLHDFSTLITEPDPVIKAKKVSNVINSFIKQINNSAQINNARVIINGLESDITKVLGDGKSQWSDVLPLDNKTVYKQFISNTISNINAEFIRRKFAGTASTLNPSQGIITVFEDNKGKVYLFDDLLKQANKFASGNPVRQTEHDQIHETIPSTHGRNIAIVQNHLSKSRDFQPVKISLSQVEPLDNISLSTPIEFNNKSYEAGQVFNLTTIADFFAFRQVHDALIEKPEITKSFTGVRDLRPQRVTFDQLVNGEEIKRNTFDLDAVNFSWWLEFNKKSLISSNLISDNKMFNHFIDYVGMTNPSFNTEEAAADPVGRHGMIKEYAKRWVQRTNELLDQNKTFASYRDVAAQDETKNPFMSIFSRTDGTLDNFISRYDKNDVYNAEVPIYNYNFKQAENIHTNVQKANFNIVDKPHSEISPELFQSNIQKYIDRPPLPGTPYDVSFTDHNTGESINVVINGGRFQEKDGKLINKMTTDPTKVEAGTKIFVNEDTLLTGDKIRRNNYGKKMYSLPENYSIFKDANGNETILIKGNAKGETPEVEFGKFIKQLSSYSIIHLNEYNNYINNLKADDSRDSWLEINDILYKNGSNKLVRDFLKFKKQDYLKIKAELKDEPSIKVIEDKYRDYVKNTTKNTFKSYSNDLAKSLYNSWDMSTHSLVARIPAQAMQSFQSMNTVGYIKGEANNIYVSHWQLWLQGSDFDIDKVYMMMYDFKNGVFAGWSPYFDMKSEKSRAESLKLPMPNRFGGALNERNGRYEYKWIDPTKPVEEYQLTEAPNESNTINISHISEDSKLSNLQKFTSILETLNANKDAKYVIDSSDKYVQWANKHNSFKSTAGFKNYIVYNLLQTSDNPKNHIASYSPISFGAYEDIKKAMESNETLSLYDGHSMFRQQETNSIGKAVIGIAATGLKNYFGMIKYFSDYYSKASDIKNTDNEFFHREITLGDDKYTINRIAGLNLEKRSLQLLKEHLTSTLSDQRFLKTDGTNYSPDEIKQIVDKLSNPDKDAALSISSILSLATDNAKELMLSKINAGTDFAGMHIYLAIMGMDEAKIASYMTSPMALKIKAKMDRDYFRSSNMESTASKLKALYPKKFLEYKQAVQNGDSATANRIHNANAKDWGERNINPFFLDNFVKIYGYAGELTSMGGIFKVNQGAKASQESIYGFTEQLKRILSIKNRIYFGNFKEDPTESYEETINRKADYIIREKPYLAGEEDHIKDVLMRAYSEGLATNGEVNSVKYFEDESYRKNVTDYYNLLKDTFNIFDILNKLPHFYKMYESFTLGEKFLLDNVHKYNVIKTLVPETMDFDIKSKGEQSNQIAINSEAIDKQTRIFNDPTMPFRASDDLLNKMNDWFDSVIVSKFIKSRDIKLDVDKILDYMGKDQLSLMKDDKQQIAAETYKKGGYANPYASPEEKLATPGPEIDLSTEYGLAQFRYVMENSIIPFIKSKARTNGFLKEYTFGEHKNYNLRSKLSYYMDPSNLQELNNLEIGMGQLIKSSNSLFNLPIKKVNEGIENIKAIDLLYMYDLLINEGRFGGNRATILFSKDIKDKSALSRQFVDFQTSVHKDKGFVNDLQAELKDNKDSRMMLYFRLFGKNDGEVRSLSLTDIFDEDNNKVPGEGIKINNRYYTLLESVGEGTISEAPELSSFITNGAKQGKGTIDVEC